MANEAIYGEGDLLVVEPHGIEHINDNERHGKITGQFNVWFACNMHLSSIVLGGLGLVFGLGLWPTILAVLLGNFLGALGNSLCVAMGPRLGMPQLPMSRSAFGYFGNFGPAILAWLGFIGWFTVDNILGAESVQEIWHIPYVPMALLFGIVTLLIAIFGYNLVHAWERWLTWVSAVTFAILTILAIVHGVGSAAVGKDVGASFWQNFILEFAIVFSYTISWAPYAADYARYLPADTPPRRPFWYSFWGMFLSCTWVMVLGAILGSLAVKGGTIPEIGQAAGGFGIVVFVVVALGSISSNVLNMYSGALSGLTWDMPVPRTGAAIVIGVIGIVLSLIFGGPKFVGFFKDFLFVLVYWVTPWIAIIGIDYWWFNDGGKAYANVLEFYKKAGHFGRARWQALLAMCVGIAVSVPFMAPIPHLMGPIAKSLGGADISYFVSFIVAGLIYLGTGRSKSVSTAPAKAGD